MIRQESQEKRLYLTPFWIIILFIYYAAILVIGIIIAIFAAGPWVYFKEMDISGRALLGSIGMACNGSAIFYIRKIYKLCFLEYLQQSESDNENTFLRRLGTISYFFARPVFAIGFSVLIVIAINSTFLLTNKKPLQLDHGFVYLAMFVSFFGGFLSGQYVKLLEIKGKKILNKHLSDNAL